MEFEKLYKLSDENKKKMIIDLIKNDDIYWKKILILMTMIKDDENTELLDMVVENKIKEISLANKIYDLGINSKNGNNEKQFRDYTKALQGILNNSDEIYGKACKQVIEILKYIPTYYYNCINKNFLEKLEKMSDNSWCFSIEPNVSFSELKLLEETKDILSLISKKFWENNVAINEIFNKVEE